LTVKTTSAAFLLASCLALTGCAGPGRPYHPGTSGPIPRPIAPPGQKTIRAAIGRGVAFLVRAQNSNGSWGSSRDFGRGILCPVPGGHMAFQTAATALCVSALIEIKPDQPGAAEAQRRGEDWLLENVPKLRLCSLGVMYNNWAHAYGIQALARMLRARPIDAARREKIRGLIKGQLARLKRYQHLDGGWGYYSWGSMPRRTSAPATPFTTATVLVAMHDAQQAGIQPPQNVVNMAVRGLRMQRRPDFAYPYYHYLARRGVPDTMTKPPCSLARSQACNAALYLWGDEETTQAVMKTWINRLVARNGWLSMARKQRWPHEGYLGIAAYFYYYGHYYAARCIDLLEPGDRPHFQDQLAHVLLPKQEKDGSWWDFPLYNYHQAYGTGFALMSLQRCLRRQPIGSKSLAHQPGSIVPQ